MQSKDVKPTLSTLIGISMVAAVIYLSGPGIISYVVIACMVMNAPQIAHNILGDEE